MLPFILCATHSEWFGLESDRIVGRVKSTTTKSSKTTEQLPKQLKPKKPLDVWSTSEKLCLASAVFKIGDQNWVSVSRAIKPYADPSRPSEWFHQKNCVQQYYDMMEQLEQPKRKRGDKDKSESDAPSLQIMRKMTIERSEQLKKEIMEMQQTFKQLKNEVGEIMNGQWDDRLAEEWEKIEEEELLREDKDKVKVKEEETDDDSKALDLDLPDVLSVTGEIDDTTQESVDDISLTDDDSQQAALSRFLTSTPVVTSSSSATTEVSTKSSGPSHLLSSLLKSNVKTATGLQQLKREQEQEQVQEQLQAGQNALSQSQSQKSLLKVPVTQDDQLTTPPSSSAPTLSRLLSTSKGTVQAGSKSKGTAGLTSDALDDTAFPGAATTGTDSEVLIEESIVEDIGEIGSTEETVTSVEIEEKDSATPLSDGNSLPIVEGAEEEVSMETEVSVKEEDTQDSDKKDSVEKLDVEAVDSIKEEIDKNSQEEEDGALPLKKIVESIVSEQDFPEIKDEPLSPTSSISSRVSETGSKRGGRGKGRSKVLRSPRMSTRKSCTDDGGSSRHSDVELSDDDARESDDVVGDNMASVHGSSVLSESFPNSPASLSMCSDTDEEKSFKQWKKSIMLVWRAAATHKFANVFLHPVTDDIAPGYRSVVLRPMDLSTIKKNIEGGIIRTTVDFQRDMMLMFTNAIMYNSSDHNVYKMAQVMYDDVMQHIEMMMQSTDSKNLRQSRRPDASDKEDDSKKRRLSVDHSEGGKTKKRKMRLDESMP
ncbi:bromodomain-containing protein 8 isoform X2 [Aplysia californica]|uniref:Bromodomain-containing protein 8 isoform X2 n=1 Tax=Aplysia californica TaxID=6500 RepID=A0ABM0ZZN3_APLCA|nr:bromodomain-containing protein 8 isoform X2 [Aplysia californica]